MRKLLKGLLWYYLGNLIARYHGGLDSDDESTCNWCNNCLEELWHLGDDMVKTIASGHSFDGEYSGEWWHLDVTCPRCFHVNFVIEDNSP